MNAFKVGDIVRLNSGGPPMTVDDLPDPDDDEVREISVCWFHGRDLCFADLDPVCLCLVERGTHPGGINYDQEDDIEF